MMGSRWRLAVIAGSMMAEVDPHSIKGLATSQLNKCFKVFTGIEWERHTYI